jgi:hypothetical protein
MGTVNRADCLFFSIIGKVLVDLVLDRLDPAFNAFLLLLTGYCKFPQKLFNLKIEGIQFGKRLKEGAMGMTVDGNNSLLP